MSICTSSIDAGPSVPRKILIAVDFGTTYSGLSWVQTKKPDKPATVKAWPDATDPEGVSDDKVPTTLVYNGSAYRWGFQIEDNESKHEWFKLGLDPHRNRRPSDLAKGYPSALALPPLRGETCKKAVVDYFTALRMHMEYILEQTLPDIVLRTTPREYIIPVPAIWLEPARARIKSCAKDAGMGSGDNLHIITEPEAAALHILSTMDLLQLEDTFVICDAGGGTVELISYTVKGLRPVPLIEKAAPESGELCGSVFLNRIFAKYLKDRLENNANWSDDIMVKAMEHFEVNIKKRFRGRANETFFVPVSPIAESRRLGINSRGEFRLSGDDLRNIFEPVINEIVRLVMDQIRATEKEVKAVFLVGGFGENVYLRERLRTEIGENIEVKKAIDSWTAISKGALIRGLAEVSPTPASMGLPSLKALKHYGTCCWAPFDPAKHDENEKRPDSFSGGFRVLVMNWLIKKGENIRESVPITSHFYWEQLVSDGRPRPIRMVVYSCLDLENDGPPTYLTESVTELVTFSLPSIPADRVQQVPGADHRYYYKVDFDIEITCYAASTKYTLVYEGEKYDIMVQEHV